MLNKYKILSIVSVIILLSTGFAHADNQKGRPAELDRLAFMTGQWNWTPIQQDKEGKSKMGKTVDMIGKEILNNHMIQLDTTMNFGNAQKPWWVPVSLIWSYDQFNNVYRLVIMDGGYGFTSFNSGNYQGDKLVLTDLKSETTVLGKTGKVVGRITVEKTNNDLFDINMEVSTDGGKTYGPYGRYRCKRK